MKKPGALLIVVWSVCVVLGVLSFVIGGLVQLPTVVQWTVALVLWTAAGLWIVLFFVLGRPKKKKSALFVANQSAFLRQTKETNEAVSRYLDAVMRKGLLKKSAMYERPWFLLCGAGKSGKTTLLKGAGLNFPLRYPSEKDGMVLEGADQITWYFANEGVWIDTPGSLMDEGSKDSWQAFVASLQQVRPEKPVDGIALAVSANDVLTADDRTVKELAANLRLRIDELIAAWGIEFPVYLIFNHLDKVPGFSEYFRDQMVKAQDQIFGATLSPEQDRVMPRMAFAQEFGLLCKSMTDFRLDKLYKERDPAAKRMICRFVIHFEGMQEKLGAFVTELFKPSHYEGRPLFRGFYFTSCIEVASGESNAPERGPDAGMTIASHPLNPRRMALLQDKQGASEKKSQISSLFVLPLFREIMVRDKTLVKSTQKRTRQQAVRHYLITAAVALCCLGAAGLMYLGRTESQSQFDAIRTDLSAVPADQSQLLGQYAGLDVLGRTIARLQWYEDHGAPFFTKVFGFYKGGAALSELRTVYFGKLNNLFIVPAVKYLEYKIDEQVQGYGELAGPDYDALYNSVKAYLSLSEEMSSHPKDIDTTFLRGVLLDAIKQAILSAEGNLTRLPEQIETVLQQNMGVYLLYLKRGLYPAIQENQRLVGQARTRLRKLPSAQNLYESAINRLSQDAPSITLDKMLSRQQEGILKSDRTMSVLYTQEGWDKFVSEAVGQAAKDPFKLDWVIGLSADQVPGASIDKNQLYDDMVAAYCADFKSQWLSFLGSVRMDPFGDLGRCQSLLLKLIAEKSELFVLLETVANYTVLKKESVAGKAGGALLDAASKFKGTKNLAKTVQKADSAADNMAFSLGQKSPVDDLNAAFDPLRVFARSTGGALSGYEGYKDRIATLASKLATLQAQGEESAPAVFNGKDDDALLNAWKFTQTALTNMPEGLSASLRGVLLQPVQHTSDAASAVLTRILNGRWQREIIKPFTSRFSGRYPFSARGEEASFSDVMDFFRPQTGTFWGFYDRVLSPYIVKTSSGWMVRSVGSLKLNFNPDLAKSLTGAERIRDIFFKPEGTVRSLSITMTPSGSNKNAARLEVNGQAFDMSAGGKSALVNWPVESNTLGASLKIYVSPDFTQDISFNGPWGFLRLLQAARVNKVTASTVNVRWQTNVQNMYMVYQEYRLQVAGADHPFGDPVFSEFDCPTDLLTLENSGQRPDAAGAQKR
jgi:type VI secretion system protein ImpL